MTPVLPWLFLGGRAEARDLAALRAAEVRLVVNVTPPRTEDPVAGVPNYFEASAPGGGPRIAYRRFIMYDNAGQRLGPVLDDALAALERGQHHGAVLVHCAQGVSRSAAIVAAFLIKHYGTTADGAVAHMRAAGRPQVRPNDAFMGQLRAFEATVAAQRASGALGPPLPLPPPGGSDGGRVAGGGRKRARDAAASGNDDVGFAAAGDGRPSSAHAGGAWAPQPCPRPVADAAPNATATEAVAAGAQPASSSGVVGPPLRPQPTAAAVAAVSASSDCAPCAGGSPVAGDPARSAVTGAEAPFGVSSRGAGGAVPGAPPPPACEECGAAAATVHCWACAVHYCGACDADTHAVPAVGSHAHARVPLLLDRPATPTATATAAGADDGRRVDYDRS